MARHKTPNGHGLGWRHQLPDHRDDMFLYSVPQPVAVALPTSAEVAPLPIWDQGEIGSCTGHGVNFCILFDAVKEGLLKATDTPSRLMTYWGERWIEGTVNEDAGAEIRDGIKFVAKYGTCLETFPSTGTVTDSWPYDVTKFKVRPPQPCWTSALKFQAMSYRAVSQNTMALRGCLASGYPVVFGFTCYDGLDGEVAATTGYVPLPRSNDQPIGGHCVALVGYDDDGKKYGRERVFKFRNSWGDGWGDKGYGYLDYEYVIRPNLSSDFWTIRVVG